MSAPENNGDSSSNQETQSKTQDISAGEESSNSRSKRELPCSSDHPDAKRSRPAESTQKKKPVGDQSNEQDNSSALCLTENTGSTSDTRATQHCLSCVWSIFVSDMERQEMETLIEVLPFVTSPQAIVITGRGRATDPVLADTLVSRINFTNRLDWLELQQINLTAKPAAVIARSLYQAPNLRWLNLSFNPLGEGVSDLTRHLSCAPNLENLGLLNVKMTKKQVNDLTEAVRQSKIRSLLSSYHRRWRLTGTASESEDELETGTSSESEDELETGVSSESEDELETGTSSESDEELETGTSSA